MSIAFLSLDKLEPNKFNPNVMSKEDFASLCSDMKASPSDSALRINQLLVSPKQFFYSDPDAEADKYVIVDGEHRFKAANEIGWKTVPCEIREINEATARVSNYRRNRERGSLDPFKEASLFKWEVDRDKTHEEIAEAYMIDRSTVTKRLSLLKITDDTLKQLKKVPRGTITVSHLEPLATLNPELQKEASENITRMVEFNNRISRPLTVQAVTEIAGKVKEDDKKRRLLQSAIAKSKFTKCPKCKKSPKRIHWEGLPWVCCENNHCWSLETGKNFRYSFEIEAEKTAEKEKQIPQTIRSFTTVQEFKEAVEFLVLKKALPQFTTITGVELRGELNGAVASFEVTLTDKVYFSYHIATNRATFTIEAKDYKKSGHKTRVYNIWPKLHSDEEVKKFNALLKSIKEKTFLSKDEKK